MWQNNVFLILDRIRITINVLKKSDFCRNPNTEEGGILTNLKELQSKLRNAELASIDFLTIILPFTQILKSSNFAGPFKLSALETLQIFMKSNLFTSTYSSNLNLPLEEFGHQQNVLNSAIAEMVDVVATCKFIQTDNQGDEMVQLQILKTLYFTVLYIPKFVLLNCCWQTLQFFLKTLSSTAGIRLSSTRQLLAQEAIQHSLRAILPLLSSMNEDDDILTVDEKFNLQENFRQFLLHLATGMHKFTVASVKKASNDSNSNQSTRANTPVNLPSGGQGGVGSGGGLTQPSAEDQTILLFYLQLLHFMWTNAQVNDYLVHYFLTNEKISTIFHNEIFYCLINISSQWETLQMKPLQSILSIFTILLTTCPGVIRHVIEHFIHQVYIKSVMKYLDILNYQIGFTHPLKELLSSPSVIVSTLPSTNSASNFNDPPPSPSRSMKENGIAGGNGSGNGNGGNGGGNNGPLAPPILLNRTEVLEMIFESLTDLISDDALFPALYVSFDCNPLSLDLIQPLVQLLTRATSIILTTGTEKLGIAKDLGIYIVQAYKQLLHSFTRRKQIADKWYDEHHKNKGSSHHHTTTSAMITPQEVAQLNELFALARLSKRIFFESAEKFLEKPSYCFQFLQNEGLLPKPITPSIAAIFLRQNTFLDKTAVGAFLGELGKSDIHAIKHECESIEFHQQLLQCYVKSFTFSSLSVLNSLRLFLSAFRLPGEAQQIDRILVAFSEYVHHSCYENRSEIIENPEITYLLSFSIIMLNTDRHNPNIRPEKKMTLEQFIKNNTNYGKDVNQTKPLPKEYLEEIYDSISKHPIRTTHGNDDFALVTDEEWMDVNMMLKTNPYYALLISSRQSSSLIHALLSKTFQNHSDGHDEAHHSGSGGGGGGGILSTDTSTRSEESTSSTSEGRYAPLKDLFSSSFGWYSTLQISSLFEKIHGLDWLWDRDLLYATSPYLLLPGISVLIYNHIIVEETIYIDTNPDNTTSINENHQLFEWKERTGRLMELSTDFLMEILTIASKHGLWKMIDMSIAILLQISGLKDTDIAQTYIKMMSLPNEYLFPITTSGMIIESDPLHEDDVYPDHCYFIQRISYGTVQKSLLLLLNIIATYYSSMSNWSLFIYPLVVLRDFTLLPNELVFLDAEQDNLLPSNVRQEFEFSLISLDRQEQQQEALLLAQEQQNQANQKKQENTRSSFYALQLLGEALFGSSSSSSSNGPSGKGGKYSTEDEDDSVEGTLIRIISEQYNLRSSRWDSGYEPSSSTPASFHAPSTAASAATSPSPTAILGQRIIQAQNNSRIGSSTPRTLEHPFAKTVKWDVTSLRASIEKTNIFTFIAESKFLPEEHLVSLLRTIIRISEAYCSVEVASNSSASGAVGGDRVSGVGNSGLGKDGGGNIGSNNNNDVINDLVDHIPLDLTSAASASYHHAYLAITNPAYQHILPLANNSINNTNPKAYAIHYYRNSEHFLDTTHFISNQRIQSYTSAASIAWLEMLLVEIALRNRDRFHLCWPSLKYHYTRCLGSNFHKLSYITERQLSGLLKISARMLSRDNYGGVLIELLGRIFHPLFRLPPLSLTVTNATAAAAAITTTSSAPSNTMKKGSQPAQIKGGAASNRDIDDDSHHANTTAALTHQNYLSAIDSLQGLSNQIAAGMWKLFTHNVDLLPMLSLEQWETLFKIVAFGSNAGSFAAFKSFEVMAWLLHEPRLIANVPVFCIIAVKPLVYNKQAPIFVSTGAVKLLKYLHSRLEAIIQDPHKGETSSHDSPSSTSNAGGVDTLTKKETDSMDYEELLALDETSATVWKKCWLPILHALAEGVADDRVPVREACAIALCEAINDRHAYAVPPGVLIDVFVHILCPVIRVLGDYLISDLHKQSLHAAISSSATHLEGMTLTANIVTTAPGSLPAPPAANARGRAESAGSGVGGKGKGDQDWVAVDPTPRPPKSSSEEEITPETHTPSTSSSSFPTHHAHHPASAIESHVIMRCIDTLTVVFMKHVKKLSHYPSFDKLWLQFLQLFSYFLEISPASAGNPSSGVVPGTAVMIQPTASAATTAKSILFPPSTSASAASEEYAILIQQLSNVCIVKLEVLINCLQREKVFAKKEGLWLVTKEFLSQLSLPAASSSGKNLLRLVQESAST